MQQVVTRTSSNLGMVKSSGRHTSADGFYEKLVQTQSLTCLRAFRDKPESIFVDVNHPTSYGRRFRLASNGARQHPFAGRLATFGEP